MTDNKLTFTIVDTPGLRLDRWLADQIPERARNQIQQDIEAGRVRVNGETHPARYKVRADDRIEYDLPEPVDTSPRPEAITLQITYEDEHMIVIDKPAGLVVHPGPGHVAGTLVNALLAHVGPSLEGVGVRVPDDLADQPDDLDDAESELESGTGADTDNEPEPDSDSDSEADSEIATGADDETEPDADDATPLDLTPDISETGERWGIVHRLDALTSGLMMAAKTQPAFDALVAALSERRVRRQYLGLVAGYFKEDAGTIDSPIGRRKKDRKRMGVPREGGRPARTDWRVLYQEHGLALLALTLHTGRTHQIRVHMQSIGRPILGDPEYGWTRRRTLQDLPHGVRPRLAAVWPDRQMLHAARLGLMHPLAPDCVLNFRSEPPADMAAIMSALWGDVWHERIERWQAETLPIGSENETL